MRALLFDRPAPDTSATRVAEVPAPVPGPGQVTIRVEYAGINFKDVMSRRGDPGYVPAWPFVPGIEVAGTVAATGPGVGTTRAGERVVAVLNDGGLAGLALAPAALTVPVPPGLGLATAAAAPGALTTAVLLHDHAARVRAGDVVLVHSAGGAVGRALADVTRARSGARLVGAVGAPARVAAARAAGYPEVVVRGTGQARTLRGVTVVLDPQGTDQLAADLEVLEPGGRVVLFGNAGGRALDPLPAAGRLFAGNASIGGFSLAAWSAAAPRTVADAVATALRLLATGGAEPQVTVLDGLDAAPAAQQLLAEGRGRGKYVVRI